MEIKKISIGNDAPRDVNVIIEVPMGGAPVKYEVDKDSGAMFVDRFVHTAMHYPCNYGFIPHTLSDDGDPIDVLVAGNIPVVPGAIVRSRPVGVLKMEDESGMDEKILAVPHVKLHPYHENINNYDELRPILLEQIAHFFEHYKDLEAGKWVKVIGWGDAKEAESMIQAAIDRANAAE